MQFDLFLLLYPSVTAHKRRRCGANVQLVRAGRNIRNGNATQARVSKELNILDIETFYQNAARIKHTGANFTQHRRRQLYVQKFQRGIRKNWTQLGLAAKRQNRAQRLHIGNAQHKRSSGTAPGKYLPAMRKKNLVNFIVKRKPARLLGRKLCVQKPAII